MAQGGKTKSLLVRLVEIIRTNHGQKPKAYKRFIGEDYMGNKYYELFNPNSNRQTQRHFERPSIDENSRVQDILDRPVPPAWNAWLRFRRTTPPTAEEVQEGIDYFNMQQNRAAEMKVTDTFERNKEYPSNEPFGSKKEKSEAKNTKKPSDSDHI